MDAHVYLDKVFLTEEAKAPGRRVLRTGFSRRSLWRAAFTLESIERRARRFLRQAIRHGTTVVRGVVDVFPEIGMARVELLLRLKEEFSPYLDLRPSHVLLICISIPAAWYDLSILTGSYL